MGNWKKCCNCGKSLRESYNAKTQRFFIEEFTYWEYSDGKIVPQIKHYYFCSKECVAAWASKEEPIIQPEDLNSWIDGRKISSKEVQA